MGGFPFSGKNLVTESRKNRDENSYTEQCKDYIMQNYHHKIYLDEMAEAIGVSQGHLSRVFRRDAGMQNNLDKRYPEIRAELNKRQGK